jgi:hypothetical protein
MAAAENEMRANLRVLKFIHENNRVVSIIEPGQTREAKDFHSIPGVRLLNVVWDTMLALSLTNYIDYERVFSLLQVYGIQAVYKQTYPR